MQLQWSKCAEEWCSFLTVDLADIHTRGVYVIWKGDAESKRPTAVVRVGYGEIAICLGRDRLDRRIGRHGPDLFVSWAPVEDRYAAGAAAHLAELLHPLITDRLPPDVEPVPVNLPISA